MHFLDSFIQNYVSLVRTAPLTEYMYLLTILFDFSLHFILIWVCVGTLIYIVRNFSYMILFFSSLIFGGAAVYIFKYLFNINRPVDSVLSAWGQSFPSGHTTTAVIFFVMLMYIFDSYFKTFGRIVFNSFCILSIFLVAFSRVYLGVHWASDIFGGIILGVAVSYLSVTILHHFRFIK